MVPTVKESELETKEIYLPTKWIVLQPNNLEYIRIRVPVIIKYVEKS